MRDKKKLCRRWEQILVVPILIISLALLGLFTISSQQSSRLGLLPNSVREGDENVMLWGKMFDCNRVIIGLDLGVGDLF